ncbi:hypothetical protein D9Q98_001193 [Chlorella vulgaris]|uniref:Sugar phosphate transporter domain-containing protein n=1 Tax=Chlorella vulgaris TaxID=3077 RepID=A0A9D4Z3A5_CHLVU|nr:hypothetical protein D9Q98_001193 [Chlorella vulgaris]
MVTTRLQEAQQQMDTPPAGRLQRRGEEPSPSTPADAALPIARPPLKSALKTQGGRTRRQSNGWSDDTATPADAGVKKTVRIHSSNNMVHEFQTSHTTEEQLCGSDDDGAETPNSRPRRYGQMRGTALPHYSQFMSTVRHDMTASRDRRRSGGVGGRGRRRRAPESTALWLGLLFTLSWMLASSALIFLNKTLMVDLGFRFPFALTSMGQVSSMLLAWLASRAGVAPLRKAPSWHAVFTKLLPVSLGFAASLFLGNVAYLGLSVAFINIMKAATPMVTLAVGLALGLEQPSKLTLCGTALIAGGTAIATCSEAASGHFHWFSFLAFSFSVVFEGIRVVLTEKLLGQAGTKYNVMEALLYLGPITLLFLATGAYLFEWNQGLSTVGLAIMATRPWDFAFATLVSFLVNLFCYLAIKYVSATSFKVAGCLKNVLVVWGGIMQGDVVTIQELQGYSISLAGFLLFSASKLRPSAHRKASGDTRTHGCRQRDGSGAMEKGDPCVAP